MWARVKGETENALLRLPFKAAFMFRPGFIQPLHSATSRTPWVRAFYAVTRPLFPVLDAIGRRWVTTTERLGRAMIEVVRHETAPVLENQEIGHLGRRALPRAST
jgi:hypothetical protein